MSTTLSPSVSTLNSDELTIIFASFSCLVFFVVVVVLLSLIYRRDPLCCRSRAYQESHGDLEAPAPQYYSSRQTLVGPACTEPSHTTQDNTNTQPSSLFFIGLPGSYRLPSLEPSMPRLPSYESVRKKDRQRQIHMMIADRFGLNGPIITEPPPTYEESIRQSVVIPYDILTSSDIQQHHTVDHPSAVDDSTSSEVNLQIPSNQDANLPRSASSGQDPPESRRSTS